MAEPTLHAPSAPDAVSWALPLLHLRCPSCGQTRRLQHATEWPADLLQIVALCPRCNGHGRDSALLMYADGRIVAEHPPRG